jgi:hypothetical protein
MATPQQPKTSRRDKLAAIIRQRLELDEEWLPQTESPSFFERIKTKDWREFETAFRRVLELGCRGDVLLTCLASFDSYNIEEIPTHRPPLHEDEDCPRPKTKWQLISRPPDKGGRDSFRRSLDAAASRIERYHNLLFVLGQFEAPPSIFAGELVSADGTVIPPPILSADHALMYLPMLLKWCGKLLSDASLGNFKTVESIGRLIPCVYVELVTHSPKSAPNRKRHQAFERVADLLHEIDASAGSDEAVLHEAMKRFQRDYERVYRQLRKTIWELHDSAKGAPDGWQRIFAAETRRRNAKS